MIGFITGIIIGAFVGVTVLVLWCLCVAAGERDKKTNDETGVY